MLKIIKIFSLTGNETQILKLFKEYVIDFLKKNCCSKLLPQSKNPDWQWVTNSSPPKILDKISWNWNTRIKEDGAIGICTIYFKSDEQMRSQTSEKVIKDEEVYNVEITVTN